MRGAALLDASERALASAFQSAGSELKPVWAETRVPVDLQLSMPKCQVLHTCPACNSAGPKVLVEKKRFSIPAMCNPLNTILLRGYRETFYYPHCGRCGHTFPTC